MLDSGKLPCLGGCTPEAECQWWADRLGDETTRRVWLSACEKMPTVFPHLRQSPVVGVLNPGDAWRGLTRRRAAQNCRSKGRPFLLVIEWAAELSCDTNRSLPLWPCAG